MNRTDRARARGRIGGMLHDRRATFAIEFALILPALIILLFGVFEVTQLVRANLKLNQAAWSLSKMVAQQPGAVSSAMLNDMCFGARLMLGPFSNSPFAATITKVTNDPTSGALTIAWQENAACRYAGPAVPQQTAFDLATKPSNLVQNPGDSVVLVTAQLTYKPVISFVLRQNRTLSVNTHHPQRVPDALQCTDCGPVHD